LCGSPIRAIIPRVPPSGFPGVDRTAEGSGRLAGDLAVVTRVRFAGWRIATCASTADSVWRFD